MGVAKYSPTVSHSYRVDQDWFRKNGGDFDNGNNPNSLYDNDGFDSYGYAANGLDRAGYTEDEYGMAVNVGEGYDDYYLKDRILQEWDGINLLTDQWPMGSDVLVKVATKIIDGADDDLTLIKMPPQDVQKELARLCRNITGTPSPEDQMRRTEIALAKAWAYGQRGG